MTNKKMMWLTGCILLMTGLRSLASASFPRFQGLDKTTTCRTFTDPPTLSPKSSETLDSVFVFSYAISYVNADVVSALNDIKKLHQPGASIAFDLSPFEVDEVSLTLKVGIKKGIYDQGALMSYLQKKLNYAFSNR